MRQRDWKHKTGYTYGLHGTPTTFLLEERLCALEGGQQCVLVPSGLAAITTTLLALLKAGDHVLLPDNVYGPAKTFAEHELAAFGISHSYFDPQNPDDLRNKITPATRVACLEAPGSVTMEFPDLAAQIAICRANQVISVLDNTWGAGIAFPPFAFCPASTCTSASASTAATGVDVSVQALTKYPSGGGDVLMGSIITQDDAIHQLIKMTHMRLGMGVGANDVETILRSLPSIALRYRAHDQAARALARHFQKRPEVAQVLHPALEGSPGHLHWKALCVPPDGGPGSAAGLFSVVFQGDYSSARVDRFCDSLRLFKIGYSWAGPVSLVVPYDVGSMRNTSVSPWPHSGVLVRFSVGLECIDDLLTDVDQALAALNA